MLTRQHILAAARASLASWGYHDPQLMKNLYSAPLLPGAAYSSNWSLQFRVRKGADARAQPIYVRMTVQEVLGTLFGGDHEESSTPFAVPLFASGRA